MRIRRRKRVDRLEDRAVEILGTMFDENHPNHDEYWRESAIRENCVHYGSSCPDDCYPGNCRRFRFKPGHKFEWLNEVFNS